MGENKNGKIVRVSRVSSYVDFSLDLMEKLDEKEVEDPPVKEFLKSKTFLRFCTKRKEEFTAMVLDRIARKLAEGQMCQESCAELIRTSSIKNMADLLVFVLLEEDEFLSDFESCYYINLFAELDFPFLPVEQLKDRSWLVPIAEEAFQAVCFQVIKYHAAFTDLDHTQVVRRFDMSDNMELFYEFYMKWLLETDHRIREYQLETKLEETEAVIKNIEQVKKISLSDIPGCIILTADQSLEREKQRQEILDEKDVEIARLRREIDILCIKENLNTGQTDPDKKLQEENDNLVIEKHRLQKENERLKKKLRAVEKGKTGADRSLKDNLLPKLDYQKNYLFITMEKWTQNHKFTERFPNGQVLSIEEAKNFNGKTSKADAVIYCTSFASHGNYHYVKQQCRDYHIPFIHTTSINIDALEDEMRRYFARTDTDREGNRTEVQDAGKNNL